MISSSPRHPTLPTCPDWFPCQYILDIQQLCVFHSLRVCSHGRERNPPPRGETSHASALKTERYCVSARKKTTAVESGRLIWLCERHSVLGVHPDCPPLPPPSRQTFISLPPLLSPSRADWFPSILSSLFNLSLRCTTLTCLAVPASTFLLLFEIYWLFRQHMHIQIIRHHMAFSVYPRLTLKDLSWSREKRKGLSNAKSSGDRDLTHLRCSLYCVCEAFAGATTPRLHSANLNSSRLLLLEGNSVCVSVCCLPWLKRLCPKSKRCCRTEVRATESRSG